MTAIEFKEETLRLHNAFLAIQDHLVLSEQAGASNYNTVLNDAYRISIAWEELNNVIELDQNNVPVITDDMIEDEEWCYYKIPTLSVSLDKINSIFDITKLIESKYNLSRYYNLTFSGSLPGTATEDGGVISNPSVPTPGGSDVDQGIIQETFQVVNVSQGGYNHGDYVTKGDTSTRVFKKMLQYIPHPTYILPAISFGAESLQYALMEPGTLSASIQFKLVSLLLKNDAGNFTKIEYYKNGVYYYEKIYTGSNPDKAWFYNLYLDFSGNVSDVEVGVKVYYLAGLIKNNDLGEPDSYGMIVAGSIEKTLTLKQRYKAFGFFTSINPGTTWNDVYKSQASGFMQNNTESIEGMVEYSVEDGIYYLNAIAPPGYTLDSANSQIKQGDNGWWESVFQTGNPYASDAFFSVHCAGSVYASYIGRRVQQVAGFTGKIYYKLIFNKT